MAGVAQTHSEEKIRRKMMGKPFEHAQSSAKIFGGCAEDYLPIHELLDSSRVAFNDVRHRALTHNKWFIVNVLLKIFGHSITNSAGKEVSVERIAELHVTEDYPKGNFIPSVDDWLKEIVLQDWMINDETGAVPPSRQKAPQYRQDIVLPKKPKKKGVEEEEPEFIPSLNPPDYFSPSLPRHINAGPGMID
jgi:hypothetical protein